jgi:hypothetical protein
MNYLRYLSQRLIYLINYLINPSIRRNETMKYPMKLMISGSTVAELRENAIKFLEEIDGIKCVETSQEVGYQLPLHPKTDVDKVVDKPNNSVMASPAVPESAQFPAGPIGNVGQGEYPQAQENASAAGSGVLAGELDTKGLPYDKRIHSVNGGKNKDGTWRYRRGVEEALVTQVENELRQRSVATAPINIPAPPAPTVATPGPVASPFGPPPSLQIVPQPATPAAVPAATLPSLPPQQPVTLTHSFATFRANLVAVLAELVKQSKLTQEYIRQLQEYFKVEHLWQVNDEQAKMMFDNFVQGGLLQRVEG